MKLSEAIGLAEQGKKLTSSSLPAGAVMKTDASGELRVVFEATGDGHTFTPRDQHYIDDWREVGGWASYARA